MTDTKKLQGKMREKGLTIKSLATMIGISDTGLFNKIHNRKEFLVSEVLAIARILCLSDEDVQKIFFANNVELKSTNKKGGDHVVKRIDRACGESDL